MSKGQQVDLIRLPPLSSSSSCKYVDIHIDKKYFQKYCRHILTSIVSWIVILQLSEIRRMSVEHITRLMMRRADIFSICLIFWFFLRFSKPFSEYFIKLWRCRWHTRLIWASRWQLLTFVAIEEQFSSDCINSKLFNAEREKLSKIQPKCNFDLFKCRFSN